MEDETARAVPVVGVYFAAGVQREGSGPAGPGTAAADLRVRALEDEVEEGVRVLVFRDAQLLAIEGLREHQAADLATESCLSVKGSSRYFSHHRRFRIRHGFGRTPPKRGNLLFISAWRICAACKPYESFPLVLRRRADIRPGR